MGKKSGPPAPDYSGLADKTADASKEVVNMQTWANRADQNTPFGSTNWTTQAVTDPATGQQVTKWVQNTTLNPAQQNALDSQLALQQGRSDIANSMLSRTANEFGQPMDWGNLTNWAEGPQSHQLNATTTGAFNFGDTRKRAEDAIYGSATARLDPQWKQREDAMRSQLANQGITAGSEAYEREIANMGQARDDAYNQARMSAITGGGAEAQRDLQGQLSWQNQAFGQQQAAGAQNFNQGMASSNYQNQMRTQQIAEAMQRRGFSLNEINALISGQQVGMPQFSGYNTAAASQVPDYLGAGQMQFQAGMDKQNAQNAFISDTLGAATSMFSFSDARLKRDLKRIGTHPRGFGIYTYRFIGERGRRVGVIAQEVRRHAPDLVRSVRGVLQVNYGSL